MDLKILNKNNLVSKEYNVMVPFTAGISSGYNVRIAVCSASDWKELIK